MPAWRFSKRGAARVLAGLIGFAVLGGCDWVSGLPAGLGMVPEAAVEAQRPYDFGKLTGTWQGPRTGSGDEWRFAFGGKDDVVARGLVSGEWYRGKAVALWDLGADAGGALWVVPGGTILDVDIDAASTPTAIGKLALGSYRLVGERLTVCSGRPGLILRTKDHDPAPPGIRCFVLTLIDDRPLDLDTPRK